MSDKYKDKLKWMSLIVLIIQTSALILIMRYSRTQKRESVPLYLSSTAIVTAEIIKFFSCLLVVLFNNSNILLFFIVYNIIPFRLELGSLYT